MSDGMLPVMRFSPKISVVPAKCRMLEGRLPVSIFFQSLTSRSCLSLPKSIVEMGPVRAFTDSSNSVNLARRFMDGGNGPVRAFPRRKSQRSCCSSPMQVGIVPVSPLLTISSSSNVFARAQTAGGSVPLMGLSKKLKSINLRANISSMILPVKLFLRKSMPKTSLVWLQCIPCHSHSCRSDRNRLLLTQYSPPVAKKNAEIAYL
mmetsp:Transcript_26187/g.48769  ORF Transcript_26187/g.48769 Transcript_26187/m.48769 type:complete len:205 (+) Transcript_26187:682-1296(+)